MSHSSFPLHHANSSACEPGPSDRSNSQGSASGGTDDQPSRRSTAHRSKSGPPKNTRRTSNKVARTKSGCYTCRIRRKKCDENRNEHGQCETCARLRLQCLGFGDRRPDWLRDNETVNDIRKKIKGFLGSQGLIKGSFLPHDEPTARDFLWLSDEGPRNAPSDDEGPAASQPHRQSPPLRHLSDSMTTALEPIDARGNHDDMWEGYNDLVPRFPHQMPPNGYHHLRDATHYSADPMFALKQEEDVTLDNLGLEPDSESPYSFQSGATNAYSVDGDHGLVNVSSPGAEPGLGDERYRYSYQRTSSSTSGDGQMMLPGHSQSSINNLLL